MPVDRDGAVTGGQHVQPNMIPVAVRTKVWLEVQGHFVMGEGALELLEGLERDSSLTGAAAKIGWSYRHAWGYVRRAERALGVRLTSSIPGKGRLRGTTLTPEARALLALLTEARRRARATVDALQPDRYLITTRSSTSSVSGLTVSRRTRGPST
jgi:molybdate transport system regulatory protein